MSMDMSLAQEYLNKNNLLLELYNDYDRITKQFYPYVYDGKVFIKGSLIKIQPMVRMHLDHLTTLINLSSSLQRNANLIAQLEYHFRNIPIEESNAQLNLIVQYMKYHPESEFLTSSTSFHRNDSLLMIGCTLYGLCKYKQFWCTSKATAAISHLLITLLNEAGANDCVLIFNSTETVRDDCSDWFPVKGLESGTVAVIYKDADVNSAVDKFIKISKQGLGHYYSKGTNCWSILHVTRGLGFSIDIESALLFNVAMLPAFWALFPLTAIWTSFLMPNEFFLYLTVYTYAPWHLRRILVEETVIQQFEDAVSLKSNFKKSKNKFSTLTYGRTFLSDPVESKENPSIVTVEVYRNTKDAILLVQQDKTRYLSLWSNGISEINEMTHSTKSPVVWVNNVGDFRATPQVSEAVFLYTDQRCQNFYVKNMNSGLNTLLKLSQSWKELDLESRHEILLGVLDKLILLNPSNKLYTEIRNFLVCALKSFKDVSKNYVCMGISQSVAIVEPRGTIISVETFKLILLGKVLLINRKDLKETNKLSEYGLVKEARVPIWVHDLEKSDFERGHEVTVLWSNFDVVTQVVWTI